MTGQNELKLLQYADDITLFLPNIECVNLILQRFLHMCGVGSETVDRLFYECSHKQQFWKDFKRFWFALSGEHVEISLQDA